MGLNGGSEPLVTAAVPPGVYTSATITYSGATIACVSDTAGITVSTYADYGNQPHAGLPATVSLPSPITIGGSAMALVLTLPVAQSMTLSGCTLPAQYSIAPAFTLAPIDLAATPTDSLNGKAMDIEGRVLAVGTAGSSFTVSTDSGSVFAAYGSGAPLSFIANAATTLQGITSLSQLASGMFVDMDEAIQPDGTLLATRIAVEDPSAKNVFIGPLLQVDPLGYISVLGRFEQGDKLSIDPVDFDSYMVDISTIYKVAFRCRRGRLAREPAFCSHF